MIKDFIPRLYQETILATAANYNTLVVLPTGLGKTAISMLLAANRMNNFPQSKILIIAPTKPLVQQHLDTFKKHIEIDENRFALLTGEVAPEKREEIWKDASIIFSTPQGFENDIISNKINFEDVSLLVFDEAHRAVGNYSYVFLAKMYYKNAKYPRILALTASPGSDIKKIQEIMSSLFIEKVEVRTESDADVNPYIKNIDIQWVKVELPKPFKEVQGIFLEFLKERMKKLKEWGVLRRADLSLVSKKDLLNLQAKARQEAVASQKNFVLWNAISVLAEIMKIYHALELIETQGINVLYKYLCKMKDESVATKTKALKNVVSSEYFKAAMSKTESMFNRGFQHPKLVELQKIIEEKVKAKNDIKIIIFNQYRDNAANITEELNKIQGASAKLFVGQMKKGNTGLSQKQQKEILDEFKKDKFNVLVATSIGEEGLDIPKVDLVIFYEPVPSEIRHIQRRGRTGRQEKGDVIVLMAKDTRDEGYRWSSHQKEKKMHRNLIKLKNQLPLLIKNYEKNEKSEKRDAKDNEKARIYADYREKNSGVIKELIELGADIKLEQLESADYILSSRAGIELKTVNDFVDSIIDGRLLQQIKMLKENFQRPLIIIEGSEDMYCVRNVHQNAINGMLSTIAVSYGIPILLSKNSKQTASLLFITAKREQEEIGRDFSFHAEKKPLTLKEQQEYVVSSLPNVGPILAKDLLKEFKSVKKVLSADEEKLQKIKNIGESKAKKIKEVIDSEYPNLP